MYKFRQERHGGSTNEYPVDDETTMWVESGKSVQDLMELAKIKWPHIDFEDITIESVHHHQYCIYYDLHESSDYVDYLVLSIEE